MVSLCPIPGMATNQQASPLRYKILDLFHMIVAVCCTNKYAEVFLEPCQLALHPTVVQKLNMVTERWDDANDAPPAFIQPMDCIVPKWSK